MQIKKVNAKNKTIRLIKKNSLYDRNRHILFSKNYVLTEILKKIKPVLQNELRKDSIPQFVSSPENPEFFSIYSKIKALSSLFELDSIYLINLLFTGRTILTYFNNQEVITSPNRALTRTGIYVRYNPLMDQNDWLNEFRRARQTATQFPNLYPQVSETELYQERVKNQVGSLDTKGNFELYHHIETKIPQYLKLKLKSGKEREFMGTKDGISVIDRIISDIVAKTGIPDDDDMAFNTLKRKYQNIYYTLSERYRLPTFTELSKYSNELAKILT